MTDTLDDALVPSGNNQYVLYRSFINKEEAIELKNLLDAHQISCLLNIPRISIDPSIIGKGIENQATIKVLVGDLKRVDSLLEEEIKQIPNEIFQKHPLQHSTDEELYAVLIKPDEWSIENVTIAKMILAKRGKVITEDEIERLRSERIDQIRKGKEGSLFVIISLLVLTVLELFQNQMLFSLISIGVGGYYFYAKNYDLNGDIYQDYNPSTRRIGLIMALVALVFILVQVLSTL